MALAGITTICEPGGFWLGNLRKHAGSFFDYFDHLINYERARAAERENADAPPPRNQRLLVRHDAGNAHRMAPGE